MFKVIIDDEDGHVAIELTDAENMSNYAFLSNDGS